MLQKNDLERGLRIWGPIKSSISRKLIELWGRIKPEFVISFLNVGADREETNDES